MEKERKEEQLGTAQLPVWRLPDKAGNKTVAYCVRLLLLR